MAHLLRRVTWPRRCDEVDTSGAGGRRPALGFPSVLRGARLITPSSALSAVVVTHKVLRKARGNLEVMSLGDPRAEDGTWGWAGVLSC